MSSRPNFQSPRATNPVANISPTAGGNNAAANANNYKVVTEAITGGVEELVQTIKYKDGVIAELNQRLDGMDKYNQVVVAKDVVIAAKDVVIAELNQRLDGMEQNNQVVVAEKDGTITKNKAKIRGYQDLLLKRRQEIIDLRAAGKTAIRKVERHWERKQVAPRILKFRAAADDQKEKKKSKIEMFCALANHGRWAWDYIKAKNGHLSLARQMKVTIKDVTLFYQDKMGSGGCAFGPDDVDKAVLDAAIDGTHKIVKQQAYDELAEEVTEEKKRKAADAIVTKEEEASKRRAIDVGCNRQVRDLVLARRAEAKAEAEAKVELDRFLGVRSKARSAIISHAMSESE